VGLGLWEITLNKGPESGSDHAAKPEDQRSFNLKAVSPEWWWSV
jgi:hypothetical protein